MSDIFNKLTEIEERLKFIGANCEVEYYSEYNDNGPDLLYVSVWRGETNWRENDERHAEIAGIMRQFFTDSQWLAHTVNDLASSNLRLKEENGQLRMRNEELRRELNNVYSMIKAINSPATRGDSVI